MPGSIGRRRFIRISAASAALGAAALAPGIGRTAAAADDPVFSVWRGITLGTLTRLEIRHPDRARAASIMRAAAGEIERLQAILTLYHPESVLVRLNGDGRLDAPPADLVRVLSDARAFGDLTGGAFDVTVQPLWQTYAAHFSVNGADPSGPSPDAIRRAVDLIGYRAIEIEPSLVRLARPGMAVTLNGMAQGYITDRIVDLLKNQGLEHVLVDLGEIRAAGSRTNQAPWRAGIRDPFDDRRIAMELPLTNEALATSGGYGFRFDATGRFHHIFDPRSGACPQAYASVSVLAPTATAADALATACNLMSPDAIGRALSSARATRAFTVDPAGTTRMIDA